MRNQLSGNFTCEIIDGNFTCEIIYGNFTCEIIHGNFTCEITYGNFTCEMIYGNFTCEIIYGNFTCEITYGNFTCEIILIIFSMSSLCSHAAEIKKQKDVMQTAEKLRREKWIKDKSQQIKELTVKGLEPDIQKLIAKHKAEIKKLKSGHQVRRRGFVI